jgi:uridine kinase
MLEQDETQVGPRHDQFVKPFKRYADMLITKVRASLITS